MTINWLSKCLLRNRLSINRFNNIPALSHCFNVIHVHQTGDKNILIYQHGNSTCSSNPLAISGAINLNKAESGVFMNAMHALLALYCSWLLLKFDEAPSEHFLVDRQQSGLPAEGFPSLAQNTHNTSLSKALTTAKRIFVNTKYDSVSLQSLSPHTELIRDKKRSSYLLLRQLADHDNDPLSPIKCLTAAHTEAHLRCCCFSLISLPLIQRPGTNKASGFTLVVPLLNIHSVILKCLT